MGIALNIILLFQILFFSFYSFRCQVIPNARCRWGKRNVDAHWLSTVVLLIFYCDLLWAFVQVWCGLALIGTCICIILLVILYMTVSLYCFRLVLRLSRPCCFVKIIWVKACGLIFSSDSHSVRGSSLYIFQFINGMYLLRILHFTGILQ